MIQGLPCFYFPTTVALIDDNRCMLESLSLNINQNIPYRLYDQPDKIFDETQSELSLFIVNSEFIIHPNDDEDAEQIKINYPAIRKLASNSRRFSYISTLVVDYAMPKMTGIELCQRMSNIPIKKIMLTGEASPLLAIQAFNKGVIDQFIIKTAPDMLSHLNSSIMHSQWDFFIKLSKGILTV